MQYMEKSEMNTKLSSLVIVLLSALLSACGVATGASSPVPAPVAAPTRAPAAPPSPLGEAILKNARYELPDIGPIQLRDGNFEIKSGQGASQIKRGDFQRMVVGDLNGDGAQDAVVILSANTGGSGAFIYMVVIVNQNGAPKQVATELLGDRAQIKALNIAGGQLDVDYLGFGPQDPMCCPSQATTRSYRLQGDTLAQISDSSSGPAASAGKLSEEMLKNARYELPDIGSVQLKDGSFEHKYGEGATQVNKVGYVEAALGDHDAAVILWANTGGSGTFLYLVAVTNQNGAVQQVASQLLGDRVKAQKLVLQNGQIVVNVLSFGPNDPQCCPSQLVIRAYRLEGGALKVVSEVKPTTGTPGASN